MKATATKEDKKEFMTTVSIMSVYVIIMLILGLFDLANFKIAFIFMYLIAIVNQYFTTIALLPVRRSMAFIEGQIAESMLWNKRIKRLVRKKK